MVKLQVLKAEPKSGISKAGRPYSFQVLKCVVTRDDGDVEVGEVVLFDSPDEIRPGVYVPDFHIKRNNEGRLEGAIASLRPVASAAMQKAA